MNKEEKLNILNFDIRVFRAVDDPESSERFLKGHSDVLTHYNVVKVTSANAEWMKNPNSYVIVAEESETKEMVGGIRVHRAHEDYPLPMQDAIWHKEPKIFNYIKQHAVNGTAEICGLWNSRKVKGLGISFLLVKMSCSILDQVDVSSFLGLCSPFTLSNLKDVGFVVEKSLGNKGTFYYPKEDLIATTIVIPDSYTFEYAQPANKKNILEMRKNRKDTLQIKKDKSILDFKFDLTFKTTNIELNQTK